MLKIRKIKSKWQHHLFKKLNNKNKNGYHHPSLHILPKLSSSPLVSSHTTALPKKIHYYKHKKHKKHKKQKKGIKKIPHPIMGISSPHIDRDTKEKKME